MIPAAVGGSGAGSSSYLAQHLARQQQQSHHGNGPRLLTDKEGYLRHLEHQLSRVEEACSLASAVAGRQEELTQGLEALRALEAERASAWVGVEEARQREMEGVRELRRRVEGVEGLADRLAALEVAVQRLEEQQRKPAMALADGVAAMGGRVDEMGQRIEGLEALGKREREASEAAHAALAARCEALEAALAEAKGEVRLLQERARGERDREAERLRHEITMAENRLLAAVARQAGVTQNRLAELRQELLTATAAAASVPSSRDDGGDLGRYLDLVQPPNKSGPTIPEVVSPSSLAKGLEGRVAHLAAAVQRAEAARAREQAEGKAAVEALRRGLGAVGEKAVEAARLQTHAVLEVVGQLEARLAAAEERAAAESRALRGEMGRVLSLLGNGDGDGDGSLLVDGVEEDGPLAAALELIEALEAEPSPKQTAQEEQGSDDGDEERWALVRAALLRAAREEDGEECCGGVGRKYHIQGRQRRLRGRAAAVEEEEAGGNSSSGVEARGTRSPQPQQQRRRRRSRIPPPDMTSPPIVLRPRPSSLLRQPAIRVKQQVQQREGRESPSFLEWLARGKDAGGSVAAGGRSNKGSKRQSEGLGGGKRRGEPQPADLVWG